MQSAAMLIVIGILAFAVIGGLSAISGHYALDGIKSRTVGDGQYGTARMATKKEILNEKTGKASLSGKGLGVR